MLVSIKKRTIRLDAPGVMLRDHMNDPDWPRIREAARVDMHKQVDDLLLMGEAAAIKEGWTVRGAVSADQNPYLNGEVPACSE